MSDELLDMLRDAATAFDPVPDDLADRMIAAMAMADISREYALLTLVDVAASPVRGDSETSTLQFSDGTASILLHISRGERSLRRIDGWADAEAQQVRLTQGSRTWSTLPDGQGRFSFDEIPAGLCRVQLVTDCDRKDLTTPQFEV